MGFESAESESGFGFGPMPAPHIGLYATDGKTSIQYLVDTGACVSIIPASSAQQQFPDFKTSLTLTAANGTSIPTYGTTTRTIIQLNGCAYVWKFTLAQTSVLLLGADFLAHHGLMVDLRHGRLVDPKAIVSVQLQRNPVHQPVNTSHVNSTPYQHVIDSFRDVFRPQIKHQRGTEHKHGVYHHITTSGPPVFSRPRRLSPQKLQQANTAFREMEAMGVCTKASSPWAAPLHMTPKTDDTWRPFGDYRRLNNVTEADKYPMPNIQDITNAFGKATVFFQVRLVKGVFSGTCDTI